MRQRATWTTIIIILLFGIVLVGAYAEAGWLGKKIKEISALGVVGGVLGGALSILVIAPVTATLVDRQRRERLLVAKRLVVDVLRRDVVTITGPLIQGYIRLEGAIELERSTKRLQEIAHDGPAIRIKHGPAPGRAEINEHRAQILKWLSVFRTHLEAAAREFSQCQHAAHQLLIQTGLFAHIVEPEETSDLLKVRAEVAEVEHCARSLATAIECGLATDPIDEILVFDHLGLFDRISAFTKLIGGPRKPDPWVVRAIDRVAARWTKVIKWMEHKMGRKIYTEALPVFAEEELRSIEAVMKIPREKGLLPGVEKQKKVARELMSSELISTAKMWLSDCDAWLDNLPPEHERSNVASPEAAS